MDLVRRIKEISKIDFDVIILGIQKHYKTKRNIKNFLKKELIGKDLEFDELCNINITFN